MDSLSSKLQINLEFRQIRKGTPENANSERNYYVGKFTNELNKTRGAYPKLSYSRIAKALSHLSVQDLHYFWRRCEESNKFGQCFWGMLKIKKDDSGAARILS